MPSCDGSCVTVTHYSDINCWARLEDGTSRVFCDGLCAERWSCANWQLDVQLSTARRQARYCCLACSWCGATVGQPVRCELHGDACPEFQPTASFHVQRAVALVQRRWGPLTPRGWQYLIRHAELLYSVDQLHADRLARHLSDVAVDWAR